MERSPGDEVRLPQSVEMVIQRICIEKGQPQLKNYARQMLAEIGEEAAVEVLTKVLSSASIQSFSGFVSYVVKKDYPIQAAAAAAAAAE